MKRLTPDITHWVIYKITNPTGNIYIGKTHDFAKRMTAYRRCNCKNQRFLSFSLKKYGFDQHSVEILDEFEANDAYADDKEMFWIRSFMANRSKWGKDCGGMNLTDGGDGRRGAVTSEATKQKLREYNLLHPPVGMKGRKLTQEHIQKIQQTKSSRVYPKRDRGPMSEEARLKMSLAKRGKPPHNKGKPMPVHQVELMRSINKGRPSWNKGKKFEGTEEERKRKFGAHNLGNSYNKGRKHSPEVIEARRIAMTGKPNVKLYKPILQYSLDGVLIQEFDSIKNASKETGLSCWTIGNIAKGRMQNPDKFIFKYK